MTALRNWSWGHGDDAAREAAPDSVQSGTSQHTHSPPSDSSSPPPPSDTLGVWLLSRRLELGHTLADAEAATRIGRDYLAAIESDQYGLLPAPVYARGFVRIYASYLALDPEEALSQMPRDLPRPIGLEPLPGLRQHEGARAFPSIERRWMLFAIVMAVVAVGVFFLDIPDFGSGAGGIEEENSTAVTNEKLPLAGVSAEPIPTVPPFEEGRAPDFSGVERSEAERVLQDLGISFVVIAVASLEALPGRVFAQTPEPGVALEIGDNVTLIVAKDGG